MAAGAPSVHRHLRASRHARWSTERPIATTAPDLLDEVRAEARRARTAARALTDDGVAAALHAAAGQLAAQREGVLAANEQDVAVASGRLDDGALDRLRLTPARLGDLERQLAALAATLGKI